MIKKIKEIKKKIKFAKIGAIIFGLIFLSLIINSVYLTVKIHKLENKINKVKIAEYIEKHSKEIKK